MRAPYTSYKELNMTLHVRTRARMQALINKVFVVQKDRVRGRSHNWVVVVCLFRFYSHAYTYTENARKIEESEQQQRPRLNNTLKEMPGFPPVSQNGRQLRVDKMFSIHCGLV